MTIATQDRITREVAEKALAFQIATRATISAIRDRQAAADLPTLIDAQNEVRQLMEVRETARAAYYDEIITQPTICFSDLESYWVVSQEWAEVLAK
jgi:hypothetical protein